MKALFVINPASGPKWKKLSQGSIEKIAKTPLVDIIETTHPGHAAELAKMAIEEKCESVIAVGGDGTVHEIGTALIGSETALGIIPLGSGNGYARSMGIPLNVDKAIDHALKVPPQKMDTGLVNERAFLGVAGWGFDALVAHRFAETKGRGFLNYVRTSIQQFKKYQESEYLISINDEEIHQKAFAVIAANTPEYGNKACISPNSMSNDGLLELVIVDPLKAADLPDMTRRLFSGNILGSEYVRMIRSDQFEMRTKNGTAHLDGEPIFLEKELLVKVLPASLNVLSGN